MKASHVLYQRHNVTQVSVFHNFVSRAYNMQVKVRW